MSRHGPACLRDVMYRRGLRRILAVLAAIAAVLAVFALVSLRMLPSWTLLPAFFAYAVVMVVAAFAGAARCPGCGFGFNAPQAWRLRGGAVGQRLNFCPHCGADFDAAADTVR